MEDKVMSSLRLPRRFSCPRPEVASGIVLCSTKENGANSTTKNFTTRTIPSKDTHTSTNSAAMSLSSQETQYNKFQSYSIQKHSVPFLVRARSMILLQEHSDYASGYTYESAAQRHPEKNEAEIINDFPVNLRRGSFAGVVGTDRLTAITASRTKLGLQGKRRPSVAAEAIDRELNSLHRNSVEERRLHQAFSKLDRQSSSGALEMRQKVKEVVKDYRKTLQRSPSAGEWHLLQISRTKTLQNREKDHITRIYSRRERHFRAPPHLRDIVSEIKWQAMAQAGLLHTGFTGTNDEDDDDDDDTLVGKVKSLNISRRHTVSGEFLEARLIRNSESQPIEEHPASGRRMTLSDTRAILEVLKRNADCSCKQHVDCSRVERRDFNEGQQNSIDESDKSE